MKDFNNLVIAIDGPAGAGKSTIARRVAEKIGVKYLDTGAMYRAFAWVAIQKNVNIIDEQALKNITDSFELDVQYYQGQNIVLVDGQDISNELRRPDISRAVSYVASNYWVRQYLLHKQRELGKSGCVLDGRDIGTNVFPDADFKFYLTAHLEERAERRMKDLTEQGYNQDKQTVLEEMKERDVLDKNRSVNPLKVAEDAVTIDTTDLQIDEVIGTIITYIKKRVKSYEK